ncbi:MAG: hypothetical protein LBV32_00335 [Tannerellaceae bacterium]|jgi:hypothetical protein|nr:hypothetical protein [Tannerellaceae bacterium]
MKNKIAKVFGKENLEHIENITYSQIHVADLTRRTKSKQAIEIYDAQPEGIDTLVIENPGLDITATFFKPQCFLDERGKEPDNCEGVFYLSDPAGETWILFLEIKDCKSTNISTYFTQAKEQIKKVVQIFRDKKIIANDKCVYANISFPRKKTDFYSHLIKPGESKEWRDCYRIFIRGTNNLKIKNRMTIK